MLPESGKAAIVGTWKMNCLFSPESGRQLPENLNMTARKWSKSEKIIWVGLQWWGGPTGKKNMPEKWLGNTSPLSAWSAWHQRSGPGCGVWLALHQHIFLGEFVRGFQSLWWYWYMHSTPGECRNRGTVVVLPEKCLAILFSYVFLIFLTKSAWYHVRKRVWENSAWSFPQAIEV